MSASLTKLADKGLPAWDATAIKGQRPPVLHQMQHEMRRHKDVEGAEAAIRDSFSQSI